MPSIDYKLLASNLEAKINQTNECRKSRSSIDIDSYSTDDTVGVSSEEDDEEVDIFNCWESERSSSVITPQSPTPPAYNSVYGTSINYANLLSNKNELLCNNIMSYDESETPSQADPSKMLVDTGLSGDAIDEKTSHRPINGTKDGAHSVKPPPEVCCSIM